MIPIWRTVIPLALFAALGTGLDLGLRLELGHGPTRWLRRVACGLAAVYAAAIHPLALVGLLAFGAWLRFRKTPASPPATRTVTPSRRWWLAGAALVSLVALSRPATLVHWDSFVWLAKSRVESAGWGALEVAALDPAADVTPPGYPLLWSMAASWLSLRGSTMEALSAGAAALTLLALLLFLDAAADTFDGSENRPGWAAGALALLAFTPLAMVHLRSAYVDLPVGLLAATCTLRLARAARSAQPSTDFAVAAIAALLLVGLKDEGLAHLLAAVVAASVLSASARRPALGVIAVALVPFVTWRVLLALHHVSNPDHGLGAPAVDQLGPLAEAVSRHLADVRSWGALWPLTLGCGLLVAARRRIFTPATKLVALALAVEAALLLASIVFGSPRVRTFAFSGTLINRLLIQLVPAAGALLALAVGDAAAKPVRTTSGP